MTATLETVAKKKESPPESAELQAVATEVGATAMQVALAWLLRRAETVLLIPGTSSLEHLRENLAGAELVLSAEAMGRLDTIGRARSEAAEERA